MLSVADAAPACHPCGQLPMDQEIACLLAASQSYVSRLVEDFME